MTKTKQQSKDVLLLPGQELGELTYYIDVDGFAELGVKAEVDENIVTNMLEDYLGLTPDEVSMTHVLVRPPTLREQLRGKNGSYSTIGGSVNLPEHDSPVEFSRKLIDIHPSVPGSLIDRIRKYAGGFGKKHDYTGVLLHEASHRADDAEGKLGSRREHKLRKIGGAVLGTIIGAWASTKFGVGIDIAERATTPFSELPKDFVSPLAEMAEPYLQYFKAAAFLGSASVGKSAGQYLGYRSIPTERRAFKTMSDPDARDKYADAIKVAKRPD